MARMESHGVPALPADQDAERHLLSAIMHEPRRMGSILGRVTEEAFSCPAHRTIYSALLALYTRPSMADESRIDAFALREQLAQLQRYSDTDTDADDAEVSGAYLKSIAELVPSSPDIAYYADLVLERSRDRALLRVSTDIEKIVREPGPSRPKIKRITERVLQLDTARADQSLVGLGDGLVQHAEALHAESARRINSGFMAIDNRIRGFYPGDLVVIGARPSMGKTSLALHTALNVALAGTGVLFISLEMTVPQLRNRALCMLAGLSLSEVRHNPHLDTEKKQALFAAAARYEKQSPPLFLTSGGHTPAQQMALLQQYGRGHNIGLVVIDYFQLMMTDHRRRNPGQMATELSRAIKRMAQTADVPVLLTSQLSPEPEGKENASPRLSDLREFGSLDQDADVIMLLFREDYYRRKDLSYGNTEICEIDIAKHRNGPAGHVALMFDKQRMMFQDRIGYL